MKPLSLSQRSLAWLALGMAATIGTASAQSYYPAGQLQVTPAYDQNGYPPYGDNAQYDYARVINVVRVPGGGYAANGYGSQGQRCYTRNDGEDRYGNPYPSGYGNNGYNNGGYNNGGYNNGYGYPDGAYGNGYGGSQTGRNVATVVGGVVGAVLGSQVGGGSARYATSALGSMVGGMAGRSIYEQSQRQRRVGQVTVCDPVPTQGGYGNARYGNASDLYDVTYEYNGRRYTSRMNYDPGQRVRVRVEVSAQ